MKNDFKIDIKKLNLVLNPTIERASISKAREMAENYFDNKLDSFINEIESDDLSKELRKETSVRKSKYIGGVGSRKHGGDLYSFFGFESGSENPIDRLINYIKDNFYIKSYKPRLRNGKYSFKLNIPSETEVKKNMTMDWTNRSWINAIQNGLSNIVSYMKKDGKGRSEGGVQVKRTISKVFFPKSGYFTDKYKSFLKNFSK